MRRVKTPPIVSIPSESGGNVKEKYVLDVAAENTTLDRGSYGNGLVRVDGLGPILAEEALHDLEDLGHAGRSADEENLVDLVDGNPRVLDGLAAGFLGALEKVLGHLLELRAGKALLEVLRARRVRGDEREVDLGVRDGGKLDLRLFGGLAEALEGHAVLGKVDAGIILELVDEPVHDASVPVVATQVGVAVRGLNLENAVAELEYGDIEGTAAQVVHGDGLFLLGVLIETEGERRGGRLVDDALDLEAGDLSGILGRLALRVVEIRGDGNDRLGNLFAEIVPRRSSSSSGG